MLYDLDAEGNRILPGRSGYRIEVAEIELKRVEGGSKVCGYLRNISNSRFDPVGWSVDIYDARVTRATPTEFGVLILKTRQVGTAGTIAKSDQFIPTTWEGETVLKLNRDGGLTQVETRTRYLVDADTGDRSEVKPDSKNKIENPRTITWVERR